MRILLDESLPRRLRDLFPGHEVATVVEAGWLGLRNGELLQLAAGRYDLFVTADQNLQFQQNLAALPIAVAILVARDNRFSTLQPVVADLCSRLSDHSPRTLQRYGD